MSDYEQDDDGFVGYVFNTVDPGPIVMVVTVTIGFFLLIILPIVVVLGDKYEELERLAKEKLESVGEPLDKDQNNTKKKNTEDAPDNNNKKNDDEDERDDDDDDDDDDSVLSKDTYISSIADAVKEVMEHTGRAGRSKLHKRHRRTHIGHADQLHPHHHHHPHRGMDHPHPHPNHHHRPHNPLMDEAIKEASDESSDNNNNLGQHVYDTVQQDPPDGGFIQGHTASHGGSLKDEQHGYPHSHCGVSELGEQDHMPENKIVEVTFPDENRNVCLTLDGFLDEIAAIMAWDLEMRRILKLATPFATQAIFTGLMDILTVAVIGKLIGTREVSAYVIVNLIVELATQFVGGFHEALATLCSQAIGNKKMRLAGKYVQIATILYTIAYIPFAVIWVVYMDPIIKWFGYDQDTADMGRVYGYILAFDYLIDGIGEAIHALLDVAGYENYSTVIGASEELLAFMVILVWALAGSPSLIAVGLVQFGMGVVFLSLNILIIWWRGWFKPYRRGMLDLHAITDKKAVYLICKTAMSLSFGYLLTDGEWELLTVFASFLGPAEVTAWGIFGSVWDGVNEVVDGIADASEVRCAFLLGSGQPERARLSAYKSTVISAFTALFVTSALYCAGEDLPTWLTNDPTIQHLLADLMPLFGLGNAVMTVSTMAWTLLGSQGRYRLATAIAFFTSWFFSIPISAVLSIHLNVNLQGQTAAMIVGYMISAAFQSYYLFRSRWGELSLKVMDDNDSREGDDDDNDDDKSQDCKQSDAAQYDAAVPEGPVPEEVPPQRNLPKPPSGRGVELLLNQKIGITGEWNEHDDAAVKVKVHDSVKA